MDGIPIVPMTLAEHHSCREQGLLHLHIDQPPSWHAICRRDQQPLAKSLGTSTGAGARIHAQVSSASAGLLRALHRICHCH